MNDKPTVDTTSGGTENSTNLITSGAVYNGLKPFKDRYDGANIAVTGSAPSKPYYRLFRLQTDTGGSKNASLIFEVFSLMNSGQYAKIKVNIRQPSPTQTNPTPSAVLYIFPLEVNTISILSKLHFAFNSTYNNNYLDIFLEITGVQNYIVRAYDEHQRSGSYTQFAPVKDGNESYLSIDDYEHNDNADYLINGGQTYSNVQHGVDYNITANAFIKTDGTSSQFLKADGSVDTNSYLTTTDAASTYVAQEDGQGLFSGSYDDLSDTPTVDNSTIQLTNNILSVKNLPATQVVYENNIDMHYMVEQMNKTVSDVRSAIDKDNREYYSISPTGNHQFSHYLIQQQYSYMHFTLFGQMVIVEFGVRTDTLPTMPAASALSSQTANPAGYNIDGYITIGQISDDKYWPTSPKYFDFQGGIGTQCRFLVGINGQIKIRGKERDNSHSINVYGSFIYFLDTDTYII